MTRHNLNNKTVIGIRLNQLSKVTLVVLHTWTCLPFVDEWGIPFITSTIKHYWPGFRTPCVVGLFCVQRFVDIGGIVDHHCLSFLVINTIIYLSLCSPYPVNSFKFVVTEVRCLRKILFSWISKFIDPLLLSVTYIWERIFV